MNNRIKEGTRVRVDFVRSEYEPEIPYFEAELIGRPQDVGDTFRFRFDDGCIMEINPNSSSFEMITELTPSVESTETGEPKE